MNQGSCLNPQNQCKSSLYFPFRSVSVDSRLMINFIYQLVANFVCLPLAAADSVQWVSTMKDFAYCD